MLYQSNAERIYYTRNQKAKKQRESMEDRNYRLVQLYNKVFNAIGNMKSNKDYIPVRNLLNAFSHECGADSMSVFRLYKELEANHSRCHPKDSKTNFTGKKESKLTKAQRLHTIITRCTSVDMS